MLQLRTVANALETKLNAARADALYPLSAFHDNTEYTFKVYADVGEYVKATKQLNTITKTINCILRINSDEKSGLTDETVSALWSCQLECLVPDPMAEYRYVDEGTNESYIVRFVDAVEDLVNTTLAASAQDYVKGDDGIIYYLGATYSNTTSGNLDLRHGVGESIPLSVFIDYTVIATGLSSADIKVYIYDDEYYRIYPTRLDLIRTSVQEGNLASTEQGVSKVTTQGTVLTIKISKPIRLDTFDYELFNYLYPGYMYKLKIKIEYPLAINGTNLFNASAEYTMVFSDASIAAETNLAASCTATLVEALEI